MIKTSGLRKSFRTGSGRHTVSVDAVKSVDLAIAEGEVFGFLGPNGAGKTTTLRMLATLIEPHDGEAIIAGADLRGDPAGVRRRIGYVAQSGGTWDDVSAREELAMQARMHGFAKSEALRRAQAAVTAFGLAGYADRRCKTYSGGQRRRLDIALGVIHRPKVLFLDEPTAGLDPPSRAQVWDEVRRLRGEGMTVFVTTHYLEEADALADRVAIIDQGSIVALDTPAHLIDDLGQHVLDLGAGADPEHLLDVLRQAPPGLGEPLSNRSSVSVPSWLPVPELTELASRLDLTSAGATTISIRPDTLNDVFLHLTSAARARTEAAA